MDLYIEIARNAIKGYLIDEELPETTNLPREILTKKGACFVSLHKGDELRGCIGTIMPVCKNIAAEIMYNAAQACLDPRFTPVTKEELNSLKVKVDILSDPEPVGDKTKLDPKKYGLIVKAPDGRSGVLLPDLDGVNMIDKQIDIAREKAGILSDEAIYMYRFTVDRHEEK